MTEFLYSHVSFRFKVLKKGIVNVKFLVAPSVKDGRTTLILILTSPLRCIWGQIARISRRTASEVRGQNWPPRARVTQLRHLRSDFDSDFTNEVHLGANSQDFKENSLRGQRPKLASKDHGDATQAYEVQL